MDLVFSFFCIPQLPCHNTTVWLKPIKVVKKFTPKNIYIVDCIDEATTCNIKADLPTKGKK